MDKQDLRKIIKEERKKLNIEKLSKIIRAKIQEHEVYKRSKNIMIYYPLSSEINLLELMNDCDRKNFYFPKVQNDRLLVCPACKNFKKSDLNINEPCSEPVSEKILDLIIVPALAVDKHGYRLGYGGGFYDRFLKTVSNAQTLTPVYSGFEFENLPHNEFDVPVNHIVTEL